VPMSVLKVTCPQCRTEVDTGLTADEPTLREYRETAVLVLCDKCREYQKVLVSELYLAA
jgi:RNase P subunit RPR2